MGKSVVLLLRCGFVSSEKLRPLIGFLWLYIGVTKNTAWFAVVRGIERCDLLNEATELLWLCFIHLLLACNDSSFVCVFFVFSLQLVYLPTLGNFVFTRCLWC